MEKLERYFIKQLKKQKNIYNLLIYLFLTIIAVCLETINNLIKSNNTQFLCPLNISKLFQYVPVSHTSSFVEISPVCDTTI